MGFETSEKQGEKAALEVQSVVGGKYVGPIAGNKYDLTEVEFYNTIEVKDDAESTRTGNLDFEILGNKNLPSGLSVTKAEWQFQVLSDRYLACRVEYLLAFLLRMTVSDMRIVPSCEGSKNIIFNIDKFEKMFSVFFPKEEKDYREHFRIISRPIHKNA